MLRVLKTALMILAFWIIPCGPALGATANIDSTYSGSWFNPDQSGHGFFVQVLGDDVVLAWFVFDNEGNPYWLVGVGPVSGDGFTVSASVVEGGQFPPNFDASATITVTWGSIEFQFVDCNNATATWFPTVNGFEPGSLNLTRLSSVDGLDCGSPKSRLEDLVELQQKLVTEHPDPFTVISQASWARRIDAVNVVLGGQLPERYFPIVMAELLASLGDAHTLINLDQIADFHRYPIRLHRVKEGLVVRAAIAEFDNLLGSLLLAIDGVSIEDIEARLATVISHENHHWVDARIESYLLIPEILEYIGVAAGVDRALMKFVDQNQVVTEISLPTHILGETLLWADYFEQNERPAPLYAQRDEPYWFQYLPDSMTMYMAYQQATEIPGYSFQNFVDDVIAVVEREQVLRLVIDLRRNTGGDASLATPLGDALFQGTLMPFNTPDRLFTVGGRFTFSSGLTNWIQFGQLTNGTLIGMPSGGKPDHFGEAKTFVLGRSGITVGYSTNFFPVVGDDSLDTFTPPVIVDDPTRAMFLDGRDPVLERIIQ